MLRALHHRYQDEADMWLAAIREATRQGPATKKGIKDLEDLLQRYREACAMAEACRDVRDALEVAED